MGGAGWGFAHGPRECMIKADRRTWRASWFYKFNGVERALEEDSPHPVWRIQLFEPSDECTEREAFISEVRRAFCERIATGDRLTLQTKHDEWEAR